MADSPSVPAGSVRVRASTSRIDPSVTLIELSRELIRRLEHEPDKPLAGPESRFLGLLAALVETRGLAETNRFSVEKSMTLLNTIRRHPDVDDARLAGARVADLGCGSLNPLGGALILLAAGAAECVALDPEEIRSESAAFRTLFNCAAAVMTVPDVLGLEFDAGVVATRLAKLDLAKLYFGDPAGIEGAPLRFVRGYLDQARFEASRFDIVHSNALLEHVTSPSDFIAELARISAPGAVGCHIIDGSDHRRYANPSIHQLEMLCETHDGPIVHEVNRVRPLELVPIFETHGFEVRRVAKHRCIPIDEELRSRLVEPYRSMPEELLSCVAGTIHVIKRG